MGAAWFLHYWSCSSKNDKQSGRNDVEQEWRNEEDHLDVLMMKEMHGNILDTLLVSHVGNCIVYRDESSISR